MVYIPYNEIHRVKVNQLLLKEGYVEAKDYPNEFNPDVWMDSPLEYVDMTPTPSPSSINLPTPQIPCFELLFTMIGIVAAIYLIKRKG